MKLVMLECICFQTTFIVFVLDNVFVLPTRLERLQCQKSTKNNGMSFQYFGEI